jgi:hypothetical protein
VERTVELFGPGDVVGLKSGALLRTMPFDGEVNFPKNLLAYAEFYEEDFPWRYSPAKAAGQKLRPWLALIVLKEGEFQLSEPEGKLPFIEIAPALAADTLPSEEELWAWAHVQIAGVVASAEDVTASVARDPDRALSRIICPRKLEAKTHYQGFIVPSFEAGRLAGLGSSPDGVSAQAPAWVKASMPHSAERPNQHPVYHRFQFKTGEYGDFESLVRILVPGPVGDRFGKRTLDVSRPGFGLDGASSTTTVDLEGALAPPDFVRTPFPASPGDVLAERLEEIVDLFENLNTGAAVTLPHPFGFAPTVPDDPIITPPAYGKAHADVPRVADGRNDAELEWLLELNLDPRSRAAAGLGVRTVQRRQEELMERAWQQLGDIESANQRLREAELAVSVGERLLKKHIAGAEENRLLAFTAAVQRSIRSGVRTVEGEFRSSRVPTASRDAAFKRISRPQRKVNRAILGTGNVLGLQASLFERMNEAEPTALSAAPLRPTPENTLSFAQTTEAVEAGISEFATGGEVARQKFMELIQADISARLTQVPPQNVGALTVPTLKAALRTRLDALIPPAAPPPQAEVRSEIGALIDAIASIAAQGFESFVVMIPSSLFDSKFGVDIDGKNYRGVVVMRQGAPALPNVARATALDEIEGYLTSLGSFNTEVIAERPAPLPRPALSGVSLISNRVLSAMDPRHTVAARVTGSITGFVPAEADAPRRLRPIARHPVFPDPEFEDLRQLSQDYIIPNFGELPENSLTLLASNQRFIEAFMAGLNHEMGRELLWREFPTDLRGTYFQKFWDTRDNLSGGSAADIGPMHEWSGTLGAQSERPGSFLVLVVRGELFEKYPNTVVYARRAAFTSDTAAPRVLSDPAHPANTLYPAFQGELEPNIALFGFALDTETARGSRPLDPGWFFVLQERPGQVRFGLDEPLGALPPVPLQSWNELNWGHVNFPASSPSHISLAQNAALGLAAPAAADAAWAKSSADMAYVLLQNPVLFARHASEMLP